MIIKSKKKDYKIYQLNDKFDITKPSDNLYPPFNELFGIVDNIHKADMVFFTDYAEIDVYLNKLKIYNKYVYAICGSDLMASKSNLARFFKKHDNYIAKTFVLGEDQLDLDKDKIYFLKKNVQRQEGTLITKDIEFIKNKALQENYVVCQELLQDCFLVNSRKINMRIYLLIICNNNTINFYIYNNGFMYYTPNHFKPNSVEKDDNITTGYIDRKVYEENPLTHQDFYKYLGTQKANIFKNNMMNMFKVFKSLYSESLHILNKDIIQYRFNVFGVDVAPDSKLQTKIMEVNKAPDLSYKDERDAFVKLNMVKDMLGLVGIVNQKTNNFIQIS
jgi:hypothetical protein